MINANKELLNSFFSNNLQYIVPFFQRPYVWNEENWETLWEHINRIAERTASDTKSEHFIGTLITKQRASGAIGENKLDLIDGQQRLTTFSLLLKAIATTATGEVPYNRLKDKTNDLVVFENSKGEKFIRVEHSRNDKEYFEAVMLDKELDELQNKDHKILKAYQFFLGKLKNHSDEELDNLKTVILSNVPIISMLLEEKDDEQEIFDTINSLGVRLTTGELLKNFIFHDEAVKPLYEDYWEQVFEDDEEQIIFWSKNKTSGRTIRTNIEVLLYCYLTIQKKSTVELGKLFNEYKNWLQGKTIAEKIFFLEELKQYATIYRKFPEGTELNEISFSQEEERFFHIIEKLEITTVYPLILYIYKQVADRKIRLSLLKHLESYLIRRNVCRLTSQNYNNVFIEVISKLSGEESVTEESFKNILSGFVEDTNRFPDDREFSAAFSNEAISNANAREILFCISLYQIYNPKNDVSKLSSSSYSVEHIMPQKWETNWNEESLDDAGRISRNKKIKTLGNLTLVTKSLNSSMKNAAWNEKKEALKDYSLLKITTDYVDKAEWNESEIEKRANDLASMALKIWK